MTGGRQAVGLTPLVALVVVGLIACGGKSSHSHRRDGAADAGSAAAAGSEQKHSSGRSASGAAGAFGHAAGAGGETNASGGTDMASSGANAGGEADLGGAPSAGGERNAGGSASDAGSLGAAAGGSAGAGANVSAGAGGTDRSAPGPTTFVLRNDTDASIYVQVESRQWLWVTVGGENVILDPFCWCGEPSCPELEPPLPAVAEIAPGEIYTYDWDGYAAVWRDTCYEPTVLRGDYQARFCYGASASYSANDFGDIVDDPQCKTVAFELGDASVVLRVAPPHPTTQ